MQGREFLRSGACATTQDSESVVEALVERGQAAAALAVLRRPGVSRELAYKFAPQLVAMAPAAAVDAWMSGQPPMEPRPVPVPLCTHQCQPVACLRGARADRAVGCS